MEIRNDKIAFLNHKFRFKYNLRPGPARIIELHNKGIEPGRIALRTAWDYEDIMFILRYMADE